MHYNPLSLFIILVMSLFPGCDNSRKASRQKIVNEWYGKNIIIPEGLQPRSSGRDTLTDGGNFWKKDFYVLTFTDTTGCTECNMRLYDWKLLMDEVDSLNVGLIYIVGARNFDEIDAFARKNRFDRILFYDRDSRFFQANKSLPLQPEWSAFLLDRDRNVILVGNPVRNKRLWTLYKKQMKRNDESRFK